MTWIQRGMDERLVRALEMRREVQRGPMPRSGSAYVDEALGPARVAAHAFGVSTLFLVILVVLMAGATAYYSTYSGALRWLTFAGIVGAIGFVAVRALGAFVRDPARFSSRETTAKVLGGDLAALRTTLRRAEGGSAYGQLRFEDRMREAFLRKVQVARDLPPGAVEAAMKDPQALATILGDRDLTLFVLESARNSRMYPAALPALPKRAGFARWVGGVLAKMEAWR